MSTNNGHVVDCGGNAFVVHGVCVHGHPVRKVVGCGKAECETCIASWRRKLYGQLKKGTDGRFEMQFVTLTLSRRAEWTNAMYMERILAAWCMLRKRLSIAAIRRGERFAFFRVIEQHSDGVPHMHVIMDHAYLPEIERAEDGESLQDYLDKQDEGGFNCIHDIIVDCGFGPIAEVVDIKMNRTKVMKYMSKYLAKEKLAKAQELRSIFTRKVRMIGKSKDWIDGSGQRYSNGHMIMEKIKGDTPSEEKCGVCECRREGVSVEVERQANLDTWINSLMYNCGDFSVDAFLRDRKDCSIANTRKAAIRQKYVWAAMGVDAAWKLNDLRKEFEYELEHWNEVIVECRKGLNAFYDAIWKAGYIGPTAVLDVLWLGWIRAQYHGNQVLMKDLIQAVWLDPTLHIDDEILTDPQDIDDAAVNDPQMAITAQQSFLEGEIQVPSIYGNGAYDVE